MIDSGLEIFVRPGRDARRQAAVAGRRSIAGEQRTSIAAPVLVTGAGVVDANVLAARAAEQVVDRLTARLTGNVPKSDVHGRVPAGLGTGAAVADEEVVERPRVLVDLERILADEMRRDRLVDVRLDREWPDARLAEADQALIGVHPQPQLLAISVEPDRLDCSDLHARSSTL